MSVEYRPCVGRYVADVSTDHQSTVGRQIDRQSVAIALVFGSRKANKDWDEPIKVHLASWQKDKIGVSCLRTGLNNNNNNNKP